MWTVSNMCPFSGQVEEKKFKGKYAYEHARDWVENRFNNYQQSIDVQAVETYRGRETGQKMSRSKKFHVYDEMINHTRKD